MFGLKAMFAALGRLTSAISHSAELFEAANRQLEQQLGLGEAMPAVEHNGQQIEDKGSRKNGRKASML